MKPQRRRKARSMIAAGRMGRYEVVVGAAHPEEAAENMEHLQPRFVKMKRRVPAGA